MHHSTKGRVWSDCDVYDLRYTVESGGVRKVAQHGALLLYIRVVSFPLGIGRRYREVYGADRL